MSGPLQGLKLVEMAGLGPCPLAGQLLADLGAEVIVIDRKSRKADPTDINSRSKRSVALNLKHPEGVAAALRIIESADILIEGFRPGVMEKLGLGPDVCHAHNPGLIYGRMTGWGQEGPLSQTAGHDINYLALTGALSTIGLREAPPVPPLNLVADYAGGTMFLLLGVLAAVIERQSSGTGQVVDAAMVDGVPALMGLIHMFLARGQWAQARESNLLDGGAPFYRCYRTADDQFIAVGPLEPQFFAILVEKAGWPAAHRDDQNDPRTWDDRRAEYAAVFASRSRTEWEAIFAGTDACVAPVLGWDEVEAHPHNAARGNFIRVDNVLQAAAAPRFSKTDCAIPTPPEAPGTSTRAVLAGLGYSDEDIAALAEKGVLV
jgi:alpha-methylacyl-CoA racemase